MTRGTWLLVLGIVLATAAPSAMAGGDPVDFTGSSWSGSATLAANIKGADPLEGPVAFDLDFGPQADPMLGADEFLLVLDDSVEELRISGTWSLDDKGRLVLAPNTGALADELLELFVSVCEEQDLPNCGVLSLLDVVFDPTRFKRKLTAQSVGSGQTLRMKSKLPFELWFQGEALVRVALAFDTVDVQRD